MEQRESIARQIAGINNQITDESGSDNDLEVKGGGRGWTATTTVRGVTVSAKGTSKLEAAENLYETVKAGVAVVVKDIEKADDHPAVARPKGQGSPRGCDLSCLFAHIAECVCQCEGTNHQAGWALFAADVAKIATEAVFEGPKRQKGGRLCGCGCGQMTKGGRFLQGHDRKLHMAMLESIDIDQHFRTEDGTGLVMKPATRKKLGR